MGTLLLSMLACREAAAAGDEGVLVFVRASPDTRLEMRERPGKWRTVCSAPCGERVDRDGRYRLRGGGLRGTEAIDLGAGDEVTVSIAERPSSAPKVGKAMVIGGALAAVFSAGVTVAGVYGLKEAGGCFLNPCTAGGVAALVAIGAGFTGFVLGSAVSVVGGIIWAVAPATKVTPTVEPRVGVVVPLASFAW